MKIFLSKATFVNRAPFDRLALDFEENEIAVLSATNGRGKTTVLSHIVDAFHEIARPHFTNEYEGKENKLYRLSSTIHSLQPDKPSLVYLRFALRQEGADAPEYIDYLDIRGQCTEEEYNELVSFEDKIEHKEFKNSLGEDGYVKQVGKKVDKKLALGLFRNNLLTYFPAYRYEQPGYLTDPYQIQLAFRKESKIAGHLPNPIEVVTGLPGLTNWIMDVVLDRREGDNLEALKAQSTLVHLSQVLTKTLSGKMSPEDAVRFGVGPRHYGAVRLQIAYKESGSTFYPSVFNMSSGEAALLCIFGELLRQADLNNKHVNLFEITGVVLIDEIDKHLHIKLQKEVLPEMLKMFPNVQFIVSSHSPFLSMGLADEASDRPKKIIDLDTLGISKDPTNNDLYREVYDMMVVENERFKDQVEQLQELAKSRNKPLIITEGKTDVIHLEAAKKKLDLTHLDFIFYKPDENETLGESGLKSMLQYVAKIPNEKPIIGIFDRDDEKIVEEIEVGTQKFKDYGNNVYAFCIPAVDRGSYGEKISIEHYYPKEILTKENKEGKRLFLGEEFFTSGNSKKDGAHQTRTKKLQNKIDNNGIIDEKVYSATDLEQQWNLALSKNAFAKLIRDNVKFVGDFDFETFRSIFERIDQIFKAR